MTSLPVAPGQPIPQDQIDRVRLFLGNIDSRFAKTMPRIPHWYCVVHPSKRETDPQLREDFEYVVHFIRHYGYKGEFGKTRYTYFDLDGWKYWTMGDPVEATLILNREKIGRHTPEEQAEIDKWLNLDSRQADIAKPNDPAGSTKDKGKPWSTSL